MMISSNPTNPPSERSFGLLFSALFAGLGVYSALQGQDQGVWIAWFVVSMLVFLIALLSPRLLAPFNKAWFLFGQVSGRIVSPIILGIIFFGFLTPIAVIARMCGRDELRLKRQPGTTYWINRSPATTTLDSCRNQF
jgi:hypothetical protein